MVGVVGCGGRGAAGAVAVALGRVGALGAASDASAREADAGRRAGSSSPRRSTSSARPAGSRSPNASSEHDRAGIEIRAHRGGLTAKDLGRDVVTGPDHHPGACQPGRVLRLRDAEVGQPAGPVARDQHVRGLDIAVDDPRGVDGLERAEELSREPPRIELERGAVGDAAGERLALDVLHHQVGALRLATEVVDGDEIRMRKARGEAGLAAKAAQIGLVVGETVGEQLHRHRSPEALVAREPDRGHAAGAKDTFEPVALGEQRSFTEARSHVHTLAPPTASGRLSAGSGDASGRGRARTNGNSPPEPSVPHPLDQPAQTA